MSLRHVMSRMAWRDAKDAVSSSPAPRGTRRAAPADSSRREVPARGGAATAPEEPVRALMFLSFWGPNS
ncbi:unnamed protein product [Urochloa decumbens]|uniref:Uncharacterized protein n=1 Tax=Urochloa decumbens TaxID=240449 RepID=A0ABC9BXQ8_9POAL